MIVVEPQIEVEVAAEPGPDIRIVRRAAKQGREVYTGSLVGEGRAIPGIRKFETWIKPRAESNAVADILKREHGGRSCAAQHVRAQRIEGCANDDRDGTVDGRAPEIGGVLKCD